MTAETLSHRLAADSPLFKGAQDAPPHGKGVYCIIEARCKWVELSAPEIEESGSE